MDLCIVYDLLLEEYGYRGWWPAETPFEVCVGAILTQQTTWRSVEKAIDMLREAGLLSCAALACAPLEGVEHLIFSTGFYRQKSSRLVDLCRYFQENYDCDEQGLLAKPLAEARTELLSLRGIGRETADSMLLYAGEHPIFVVDAYTHRLLERLGMGVDGNYDRAQELFHSSVPRDLEVYREFHALIVEHAKQRCSRSSPSCAGCPLEERCAYGKGVPMER